VDKLFGWLLLSIGVVGFILAGINLKYEIAWMEEVIDLCGLLVFMALTYVGINQLDNNI
jgi:hypothetical protein